MARGTITPQLLVLNGGTVYAGTAIDGTNFHAVTTTDGLWRKHFLQVINTGGTAGTVLVLPGSYPPAFGQLGGGTVSPAGTLAITVANGGTAFITLEDAAYVQADGVSISLNISPSTMVGSIYAFEMPAGL